MVMAHAHGHPFGMQARGFNPLLLSNLIRWHDASDISTLFKDSARTAPVGADNDPVGSWDDKSGNSRHIINATSTNRMTRLENEYQGFDAIISDNVDDNLFDAIRAEVAHETWWFAVEIKREGSVGLGQGIVGTTARVLFEQGGDNQYELYAGATLDSNTAVPAAYTRKILRATWNGASTAYYVNGTTVAIGNAGAGFGTDFRIGICGGQPLSTVKYFEIVCMAGSPTAAETAGMTAYLSKYNPA
jgi:hypothetical protein